MLKKIFFLVMFWCTNCFGLTVDGKHTSISVIPEFIVVGSDVEKFGVLTKITIDEGWHLYWENPGDVGEPTTLDYWENIDYQEILSLNGKPIKRNYDDVITSYVYEKEVYFYNEFVLKDYHQGKKLEFDLLVSYDACKDECIPEKIKIDFMIPMEDKSVLNNAFISEYKVAEMNFLTNINARFVIDGNYLYVEVDDDLFKNCKNVDFISRKSKNNVLSELPKTSVVDSKKIKVSFDDGELNDKIEGVFLCDDRGYNLVEVKNIISNHNEGIWYYLLLAFIAGIILNFMPCVLPVLGLKALSIVMNNKKANIKSACLYMFGVLSSFFVLAGILFYAKVKGEELGWGFQLQSVSFNLFLLLLFFVIFLNLLDKIVIPDFFADKLSKLAKDKSFLMGFFAVLIACPCTGPFMGSAIGYAIGKSNFAYWGIFLMLGLGYALPYVLVEIYPNVFLRYIPKPGVWMVKLKRVLAMFIALTCLWLGWVIFNQLFYKRDLVNVEWQEYSPQKVENDLKNDKSVFINFTAKWCLVCLFNEKTTLGTEEFKDLMNKNNVSLYKADWTSKDDIILKELKRYGRNSVPLYVYYERGNNNFKILNQILTRDDFRELLGK